MSDERRPRSRLEHRSACSAQVVVLGDDFGERTDREPARSLVEHPRRPLRRCEQRQPVLGECRSRPQLAPGLDGVAGPVAKPQQTLPVAARGTGVDQPHQFVEVGPVERLRQRLVDHPVEVTRLVAHTSGHG